MKPIVVIGVCVKDCEKTIGPSIESIMAQDFPHELIEVIFVDDGSKDKTLSIILKYVRKMDMHVKVFHGEWKGLGPARNVVVKNAEGDYILWVDGDMLLPRDHIRKQVDFMKKNPKVGIAKARYAFSSSESLVEFLENITCIAEDFSAGDEWKTNLRLPGTGGAMFSIKAIKQVGGFDENLKGTGEDQDIAYRIKEAGWLIKRSNALFYERRSKTWMGLWKKYLWYGYGDYYLYLKNRDLFILYRMIPPIQFVAGLLKSLVAYKLTRRKSVFLLPYQFAFKMTAWCLGFIKAQIERTRKTKNSERSLDTWQRIV
jgi:glycosyltransferase involved in cell wall biosynthesis